jgi:hypothetical protein
MTEIASIQVSLQTGDKSGAGSDGDAYLGFAAREYFLQTKQDDLERGSSIDYVFGDGANVLNADTNDPRTMLVQVEDIDNFPVYIRFFPENRDDRWLLQRAVVGVNGNQFPMWDTSAVVSIQEGIWMGIRSTLFLHFPMHSDLQ